MQLNEFDKALRERYESGSLPPDLAQWEQLASRLDVYEAAATPAPKPRRGIVAYWPYWAAAASVLLIGWLFLQESDNLPIAKNETRSLPATERSPEPARVAPAGAPTPSMRADAAAPATTVSRNVLAVKTPQPTESRSQVMPGDQVAAAVVAPFNNNTEKAALTPTTQEVPRTTPAESRTRDINLAMTDLQSGADVAGGYDPEGGERRRLGVDLSGGYGPGSLKRNYSLGVNLHRKLGERLSIDAGVAVVSGSYEAYSVAMADAFRAGVEAAPENTTTRLTYLQAAPSLTYELLPGIFAGAGVDAQRLLSNAVEAKGYAYSGTELETQPAWDFGYTVRAGYKLNRSIKAGLQYRNSMHVTAPVAGTSVQPRNYLLFQLGYTIR